MIRFDELFECDKNEVKASVPQKTWQENVPWVDKYRPVKLSDIVYQDEVVQMLSNVVKTGNLPHLLFYGPSGSGKTSTILAIARELFGKEKFNERVKELNASDERGISVVRNKILTMAKFSVNKKDTRYPPYKIIILDEADAMTNEAQSALRKIIEDNSRITRFCFICNYINQITEPITSRCVKFRFKPINSQCMTDKLTSISQNENMDITRDAIELISQLANGDMRKGIMLLQNLNYIGQSITVDDIYSTANIISEDNFNRCMEIILDPNTKMSEIKKLVRKIIIEGHLVINVLTRLVTFVVSNETMSDEQKSKICIHISVTERRLIEGADESLQLLSVFMCVKAVITGGKSVYDCDVRV